MSKTNKIIYLILSCLFFTYFNRYCSSAILSNIDLFQPNQILDIIFVQNTGAAFNILEGSRLFLILFSLMAILAITIYAIKHIKTASGITIFWTSLLISGIFCNTYERISLGYVRDFFKLNFINFPVFNISDIFINISVLAIVIIIIKHNFKKNNELNN